MFSTKLLSENVDHIAPDGSEIRLLHALSGGGLCHCTLPAGNVSSAVTHKTVEEIWYFLAGEGELWRKDDMNEEVVRVSPGICVTIPLGASFQFRNIGQEPLRFLISTMPPWPNAEEAVRVEDYWVDQN